MLISHMIFGCETKHKEYDKALIALGLTCYHAICYAGCMCGQQDARTLSATRGREEAHAVLVEQASAERANGVSGSFSMGQRM